MTISWIHRLNSFEIECCFVCCWLLFVLLSDFRIQTKHCCWMSVGKKEGRTWLAEWLFLKWVAQGCNQRDLVDWIVATARWLQFPHTNTLKKVKNNNAENESVRDAPHFVHPSLSVCVLSDPQMKLNALWDICGRTIERDLSVSRSIDLNLITVCGFWRGAAGISPWGFRRNGSSGLCGGTWLTASLACLKAPFSIPVLSVTQKME